jgi:hypothetical protein
MRTERLASLVFAVSIITAILWGATVPIPQGWDKAAHFVAFSALTLFLWQATGGELPLTVLAAAATLGALDEWRRMSDAQAFLVDLCAAGSTALLLFMQRKTPCAESSPQ